MLRRATIAKVRSARDACAQRSNEDEFWQEMNRCLILTVFALISFKYGFTSPKSDEENARLDRRQQLSRETNEQRRELIGNESLSIDLSNNGTLNVSDFVSVFRLKDNNDRLLVHWAGEGSAVLICLTRKRLVKANKTDANSTSNVYFSFDYGDTFAKEERMKLGNGQKAQIETFYISLAQKGCFVFTDIVNNYLFTTKDFGKSFTTIPLKFTPTIVSLHKKNANLILALDKNDTKGNLWLSDNFGVNWLHVQSGVKSFSWGSDGDDESTVYMQYLSTDGIYILSSFSHRHKNDKKDWLRGITYFRIEGKYIFATKIASHSRSKNDTPLELWISYERIPFRKAIFPLSSSRKAIEYHITDVSDDQIMVAVTYNDSVTDLFLSNVKGNKFTLSLTNIVHLNYSKVSDDQTESSVDIHKVEGLKGIFIANRWKTPIHSASKAFENMESLITFNKGSRWLKLESPTVDVYGKEIDWDNEKIRVHGLMTEPGEKTATFTIFGSEANFSLHQWILVKINLTFLFDRKCSNDDFEFWSPHIPEESCLLGQKQRIQRRKPGRRCQNDAGYVRPVFTDICNCTYSDFECDFGFKQSNEGKTCIRDNSIKSSDSFAIPSDCKPGQTYNRTRGYRKIPGDECQFGISQELSYEVVPCPISSDNDFIDSFQKMQSSHISLILIIVCLVVVLGILVARHRRLRRSFLSFVNSHYDTRSESATILVTDGLDEEDTPIIRGFADDEPLVLA
ncbi:sortilin-related receptor-like protein [Dinothrombium tinctorium]|uniref:Sortilin-related receptor-like protein n=1 Tax=Dinothrombium tinctorium TaxID=1965070 RepID=A0A3S3PQB6_9ACAR|nr:sortilin-related receptor-like protein [Dinothrombium tinctorium]